MEIRRVSVELVRAGPRHNQLLSPLTQYLGLCGDSRAGVVQLHFEHAPFLRRLNELRYETEAAADQQRRVEILRESGADMARVLRQVPGLTGVLTGDREGPETLIHLRMVLSASELALLPFELTKVPEEGEASSGGWLALQNQVATCITRRIRSVNSEDVDWPSKPKILFIAADPGNIPFEEHKKALREAIDPWLSSGEASEEGEWLTILENATIREVREACDRDRYSYIHVLAHGAEDSSGDQLAFGLAIGGEIVSGERFATAVTRGRKRPTIMTVASCDSANVGSVITQGASFAHDLHSAGIPLVVASQFPLSKKGSILLASNLCSDLLWGRDPRVALYDLRSDLHALHGNESHDWASLVVYEALPANLKEQLEQLSYKQSIRALDAALQRLEVSGYYYASDSDKLLDRVVEAQDRLPSEGRLAPECLGLKAASRKRLAELEYEVASGGEDPEDHVRECLQLLEDSFRDYQQSETVVEKMVQEYVRHATPYSPHWVQTQKLALGMILGRPFDEQLWQRATLGAQRELVVPKVETKAWAHGSLAELRLLKLADPSLGTAERRRAAQEVLDHAGSIRDLMGARSFHVASTRRQFARYVSWWGDARFSEISESLGIPPKEHWHVEHGLLKTARRVVTLLGGRPGGQAAKAKRARKKTATAKQTPKKTPRSAAASKTAEKAKTAKTARTAEKAGTSAAVAKTPATLATGEEASRGDRKVLFDIEMVPAENGDCLWIEYGPPGKPHRILIDCGAKSAARLLQKRIAGMPADEQRFDLFVLTHIDSDHISGVVPLFKGLGPEVRIDDLWFNGWKQFPQEFLGVRQGEEFSDLIEAKGLPWNRSVTGEDDEAPRPIAFADREPLPALSLAGGMRLTILSPGPQELKKLARKWKEGLKELKPEMFLGGKKPPAKVTDLEAFDVEALASSKFKKDPSVANGSSIAILAEFGGRAALLTGDAHAEVLAESIHKLQAERGKKGERLRIDALKLSHHGSANAITPELLELLDCPRYLVSSDGSRFYHPDREAIARVVIHGGQRPTLLFNYRSEFNELWGNSALTERYGYVATYPAKGKKGLRVPL